MIAFPSMLVPACEKAGISVPPNPNGKYNPNEYPHFHVFCLAQLLRPTRHGEHWENAEVIASFTEEEIVNVTLPMLVERGFEYHI